MKQYSHQFSNYCMLIILIRNVSQLPVKSLSLQRRAPCCRADDASPNLPVEKLSSILIFAINFHENNRNNLREKMAFF